MKTTGDLDHLAAQVNEFICSLFRGASGPNWGNPPSAKEPAAAAPFERLAVALFALQFELNEPYRRFCIARQATPAKVEHWSQIPAVPTAAFKELEFSCLPANERTAVFHSSGTTGQQPSRHFHNERSLAVYEASLWAWFRQALQIPETSTGEAESGRVPLELLALTPGPKQAPHSSLVHMFETIRRRFDLEPAVFVGRADEAGIWTLDFAAATARLERAISDDRPILVLGTAFSYVHLLDYLAARKLAFRLPPGSRALETGGYKGRSRELPKPQLHSLLTARLGLPDSSIWCEYGMSELSSQAYDRPPRGARGFQFPHWARVQVLSPETGQPAKEGQTGLIRVIDLANVYSVMAVQTADLGSRRRDGFDLVGRTALAEPRGCSLLAA